MCCVIHFFLLSILLQLVFGIVVCVTFIKVRNIYSYIFFVVFYMRGGCVVVQLSEAHERRVCKQRAGIGAVRDILLFVRVRKSE